MTSTELARRLSDAALAYRASRNERTLADLESLARDAAAHVRRVTDETVDALLSIRDACRAAANCEDRSDRSFRARPPSLRRAHSDQGRIRTGFGLPHAELAELEAALTWALARTVP
jgi:hypothetical protein